jgi:indole-3-glycerol phosphate synthase
MEVRLKKGLLPLGVLERYPFYGRETLSLVERLRGGQDTGIIAEFKRRSPSKGIINASASVEEVVKKYEVYGASAVSVLTDEQFFGGSAEDLLNAREKVNIPILRKEFIIDEYQVHEARALGADIILLIAACLNPHEVKSLASIAKQLKLEILLEIHEEEELYHICEEIDLVGVNNRSLKTFDVDIARSLRMASKIPAGKLKIAESGIDHANEIRLFREHGFSGFLIGEKFMKEDDPGLALKKLADEL